MVAQCSCFYSKIMGEMAVIVLTGRRVSSDKKQVGFQFKFKNLEVAEIV
jgi:NAD dependent epimerase/dehydratase family enzyme